MKTKYFDYNDELDIEGDKIKKNLNDLTGHIAAQNEENEELYKLKKEIIELEKKVNNTMVSNLSEPELELIAFDDFDDFFWHYNSTTFHKSLNQEIQKKPTIPLSCLDYSIVVIAGLIASLVDICLVKIPKDMSMSSIYYGQKSSEITKFFKGIGIDKNKKLLPFLKYLEDNCKVPFDIPVNSKIPGFGIRTHRLHSLGHDPLLGLIFGFMDIMNGKMTVIDSMGNISIQKGSFNLDNSEMIYLPFIWLGHIVSDLCTTMGIPIPGWGFTQLLNFGRFGQKDRSVAEISRWMYINGYDLRHFITMSVSTACIEMIVRMYLSIASINNQSDIDLDVVKSFATKDKERIQSSLRLHKMLFLSHTIATSGNAIKVFASQGNPLSINITQWIAFLKEAVIVTQTSLRNTTGEKITRNREKIDNNWENIQKIKIGRFDK